jgi:hypothetical protein
MKRCRDVDQQQGPNQVVLVEVAARQDRGPHLLLEFAVEHLASFLVLEVAVQA